MAAGAPVEPVETDGLSQDALAPIVNEAIHRWTKAINLDDEMLAALSEMDYEIADFNDLTLGLAAGDIIYIDADVAGYGWFVDKTPKDDAEFVVADSEADGKIDLLTVVMHELGHVLGFEDMTSEADAGDLMCYELPTGVRRTETNLAPTRIEFEHTVLYRKLQDEDGGFLSNSLGRYFGE